MSRSSFYTVCFLTADGWQVSRTFERIANARKLAKLLASESWVIEAAVYNGGPGGERV